MLAIRPDEGVFAYARIAPSGNVLAYASETRDPISGTTVQVINVRDLKSGALVFSEPGIDAYWSNDGRRMVFVSRDSGRTEVAIRHSDTGVIDRDVAPLDLGDYPSWGMRDGKDLILTINGFYYYVVANRALLPAQKLTDCPGVGAGARPLLSKNGRRVSVFIRGHVVVRNLSDCSSMLDTGIEGAKADFSWDGRYLAFHTLNVARNVFEIEVVDLLRRSVRTISYLSGSAYYPSWTRDGRLCFRYDGIEFRGFVVISNVLAAQEKPLPVRAPPSSRAPRWSDIFPSIADGFRGVRVVAIWAPWNAHGTDALVALERAHAMYLDHYPDVEFFTAVSPGSAKSDVDRLRSANSIAIRQISLAPNRVALTGALNQVPAILFFRGNRLVARHLGALSAAALDSTIQSIRRTSAAHR